MKPCIECEQARVDPEEPPRYNVLCGEYDDSQPSDFGPYCAWCFPLTETGIALGLSAPEDPAPEVPEPAPEPEPTPEPEPA